MLTLPAVFLLAIGSVPDGDTLAPIKDGRAPGNFEETWGGFDPRAEPLETEVLREWEEDGVVLRVVHFRIGVFKGRKARLAAIYGYPKNPETRLPGLVQIHGGGQYADARACLLNARRGYATVSIAWAGRISSSRYRVTPLEVKLFWEGKTDDPRYRLTTDWGVVDGYHAPSRNPANVFPSAKAAGWTLDAVESPRNSGWFLCALAARRALTFLEKQPEVDPERLGVYGHSMGGKLTVMTATDARVRAAAPSCGGISDRHNRSALYRSTLGDDVSLRKVKCPIIFLSPANDFHGRMGDLPDAVGEIGSKEWRVTCSPHHNHQDTPEYEVATLLWMDRHLNGGAALPTTPETSVKLRTDDGVPVFSVKPDRSRRILGVDVYYTQQGWAGEGAEAHLNSIHRFWHHASVREAGGAWAARLPLHDVKRPLWVYGNVRYALNEPVTGAGYYYVTYTAESFNLSSLLTKIPARRLRDAGVRPSLEPSTRIEDFQGDWEKEWFTYRPRIWGRRTNKVYDDAWKAPAGAALSLDVRSREPNTLVVRIDDHAAEVRLAGGDGWERVVLFPNDFRDVRDGPLTGWEGIRQLKLSPDETLRPKRGAAGKLRKVGGLWKGAPPKFRDLRWEIKGRK